VLAKDGSNGITSRRERQQSRDGRCVDRSGTRYRLALGTTDRKNAGGTRTSSIFGSVHNSSCRCHTTKEDDAERRGDDGRDDGHIIASGQFATEGTVTHRTYPKPTWPCPSPIKALDDTEGSARRSGASAHGGRDPVGPGPHSRLAGVGPPLGTAAIAGGGSGLIPWWIRTLPKM
jgi:hypothetical protein